MHVGVTKQRRTYDVMTEIINGVKDITPLIHETRGRVRS